MLQVHLADGRISTEEFQQRLDAVYTARTYGELDPLVADLPGCPAWDAVPPAESSADRKLRRRRERRRAGWIRYGIGIATCWAMWGFCVLALHHTYAYWPAAVTVIWAGWRLWRHPSLTRPHH